MNPPLNEHQSAARKATTEVLRIKSKPIDAAFWLLSREFIEVEDYYFFSFTTVEGTRVGFGMFGKVRINKANLILIL